MTIELLAQLVATAAKEKVWEKEKAVASSSRRARPSVTDKSPPA